jgi:hypothetical protein
VDAVDYRLDSKILLSSGIFGGFTERNPQRFGLINLQVLLYADLHRAGLANVLAVAISAILFGVWVLLVLR